MKKIFIWILITVLIAAVAVNVWFFYKREASFNVQIPERTQGLVRINTEGIIKKNIFSDLRDSVRKSGSYGLQIPLNIFAYNISENENNSIWIALFKINEHQKFQSFVDKYFTEKPSIEIEGAEIFKSAKMPVYCIREGDKAVFAYARNDSVGYWIKDLLQQKNLVDLSESKFAKIKEESDDIFLMLNDKKVSATFQKGIVKFKALLDKVDTQIDTAYSPVADTAAAVLLAYKGNLPENAIQYFLKNSSAINADSIQQFIRPGFYFQTKGSTEQMVKKVTYEYDDNFEKKASLSSELTQIPLSYLQINADSALCVYLAKNNMLIKDSINRNAFPLYALYGKCLPSSFSLSTAKDFIPQTTAVAFIPDKKVLKGWIDFAKMYNTQEWLQLQQYFKDFQNVEATGVIENKQLQIDAKLKLTDANSNAFATLYKALLSILQ